MRILTFLGTLILCLSGLSAQYDQTHIDKIKDINEVIVTSSRDRNFEVLAEAYYQRAVMNFEVPLRNQDIIGDLLESARIYKYLSDNHGFYQARMALAEFYILEEIVLDDALKLTSEAYRYFKNNDDHNKATKAVLQLGRLYQVRQDYEKAISYVNEALTSSIETSDQHSELLCRRQLVELYGKLSNVEQVIDEGLKTIDLEKKYEHQPIVTPEVYQIMANNLYHDQQYKRALEYAHLVSQYAKGQSNQLSYQNHKLLADIYHVLDDDRTAYTHLTSAIEIESDISNQEKFALINQLAIKYQTDEKEKEIQELEQDNLLSRTRLIRRTTLFIILFAILMAIAGSSIYFYRLQKQKLTNKNIITEQQEEISRRKIQDLENKLTIKNLQAMVNGQEAERTRIATDLHDSLGGMLSTLKLQYDSLQIDHGDLTDDHDYLKIMDLIDLACKDVRDIARNLKPDSLEKLGLTAALHDLTNRYTTKGVTDISLLVNDVDGILSVEAKLHVYRIVQELLNNALKHARASEIDVKVNRQNDQIVIMVEDNGQGFDSQKVKSGLGLGNLQSRIHLLNGEIEFDSAIRQGTSVTVHIPLHVETV